MDLLSGLWLQRDPPLAGESQCSVCASGMTNTAGPAGAAAAYSYIDNNSLVPKQELWLQKSGLKQEKIRHSFHESASAVTSTRPGERQSIPIYLNRLLTFDIILIQNL